MKLKKFKTVLDIHVGTFLILKNLKTKEHLLTILVLEIDDISKSTYMSMFPGYPNKIKFQGFILQYENVQEYVLVDDFTIYENWFII